MSQGTETSFRHPAYRRVLRRETYSPRSLLAIVVSVIIIVLCAYVGTEIVLAMLGRPALLAAPLDMLSTVATLATQSAIWVTLIGAGLMILGLLVLIGAITPGRRARHQMAADRAAVVVDNEVVASALARTASYAGVVDPDNTTVSVSLRRAAVHLTPTSGVPVHEHVVESAVAEQLESFRLTPSLRTSVVLASQGKVGA